MLRFALFDLDDTLYAAATGLWPAIGRRIELFMVERLGLPAGSLDGLAAEPLAFTGVADAQVAAVADRVAEVVRRFPHAAAYKPAPVV